MVINFSQVRELISPSGPRSAFASVLVPPILILVPLDGCNGWVAQAIGGSSLLVKQYEYTEGGGLECDAEAPTELYAVPEYEEVEGQGTCGESTAKSGPSSYFAFRHRTEKSLNLFIFGPPTPRHLCFQRFCGPESREIGT